MSAPATSTDAAFTPEPSLRPLVTIALATLVLLIVGLGGWAATATLSGALIAPGLVVVDGHVKKVQHPTGGVIGEIRVQNGDRVAPGQLLVKLDSAQTRAALAILDIQLVELTGRKARLSAESDGRSDLEFPGGFEAHDADASRVAKGERRLFEARRRSLDDQKAQLRERSSQLRQEIEGLSAQRNAKARELKLVREELSRVSELQKKELVPVTRVLAMQREEARIDGEHGTLVAQIARAGGQINEIGLQILSLHEAMRTDAQKELRDIEGKMEELSERKIAAEDQLRRVALEAPISGIVHELSVHTVGGVIGPGEQVMLIVPDNDELSIEVQIRPNDIDQVSVGQKSVLRFTAFNQRTTPEIKGTVARVSADLTRQAQSGQTFFVTTVRVDAGELDKLNGSRLVPGMPVEVYIQTAERTPLSYLLKPLSDQVERAFRED